MQSRTLFSGVILVVLSSVGFPQSQVATRSPADLINSVIRSEVESARDSEIRWKYVSDKEVDGRRETREVVETRFGSLDRLIAVAGRPLTVAEQRDETERIRRLPHNPDAQQRLEQAHRKDAAQCQAFLQMIPDAFLFEYAGDSGSLVKLIFKPNPHFQPSSREGRVLHEMAGEMWIDGKQQRLVSISGQLINEVKFAGGLLGHLEKGGHFAVKRTEISPGRWEVTEIAVNMHGKALLFKSISVQQTERHTNFESVPYDLDLSNAAGLLLEKALVAAKQ